MTINNQSNVNFSYTLPDGEVIKGNQPSNIVPTEIITALVTKVKSGDKTFLRAGETSTHTIVITNNSSTPLINFLFRDDMGAGASYVPGTVTINGIQDPTANPATGFTIPDIAPGGSVTITFQIIADTPVVNTEVTDIGRLTYDINDPIAGPKTINDSTNPFSVVLVSGNIIVNKSVDKAFTTLDETLTYTSVVTNTGNVEATDLTFFDPIPAMTSFIANSVTINGVAQPGLNPATGFAIPSLGVGESATVTFKVLVTG